MDDAGTIQWRIHLKSPPTKVFEYLATPDGRRRFWAEAAEESGDTISFVFLNGQRLESAVLERHAPERFVLTYFGGSRVTFTLESNGDQGTDLTMTEDKVPRSERDANLAGWVTVLLTLKAVADFGVDLRNHDPDRSWNDGYVDV